MEQVAGVVATAPLGETSRRRWGAVTAEAVALAVAPVVAFWIFGVEPFFRQNGVDPFLYIGYAWDGQDIWARYGPTYYAVRFALLMPMRLSTVLFGVEGGYFVMRYLLALAAAVAVYLPLRRLSGRAAGWLGVGLLLWCPMFLRALMTTYSDTTGLPATMVLFAALLLSVGPLRRRSAWMVVAGLAYGVAIHSNPILAVVAGTMLLPWAVVEIPRRRSRILLDGLVVLAGVVAVTLVGVIYYRERFGDADIFSPSLDAIRNLSGKGGEAFRAPDYSWLSFRYHLYLPPVVLIAWVITRWGRWRSTHEIERVAVASLAAMSAFFVVHQFLLGSSSLETYYYTSYLVGPLLVSLVVVLAALAEGFERGHAVLWSAALLAVLLPVARNLWFRRLQFDFWPAVPLLVSAVLAVLVAARLWRAAPGRSPRWLAGSAIGAMVVVTTLFLLAAPFSPPLGAKQKFRYDPYYHLAIGNGDDSGLGWYELTFDLINHTPPLAARGAHVLFWYPDGPPMLNAIQSAYLWRSSAWQSTFEGMPFMDAWRIARLREEKVRYLVLLGETPEQLDAGVAALSQAGVVVEMENRTTFHRERQTVYFDVVRISVPPP